MIVGNDVASYQGDINYDVYKNNTNFVIMKSTEGNGFVDPKFKRNQSESRRVNLPLGYYHFARPDLGNTPEAEANFFLQTLGELKPGEVLCLDYEPPVQTQADVDWCKKWLDFVQAKTKVKSFVYLNQSQVKKFDWKKVIDGGYALWIAAYTGSPTNNNFVTGQWPTAAMQQWTSSQKVPGILNGTGNVDGNAFFGDANQFKKYGFPESVPVPPTDPCEEVKKENEKLKKENQDLKKDKESLTNRVNDLEERLEKINGLSAI